MVRSRASADTGLGRSRFGDGPFAKSKSGCSGTWLRPAAETSSHPNEGYSQTLGEAPPGSRGQLVAFSELNSQLACTEDKFSVPVIVEEPDGILHKKE